jgi:hypothetical protein
MSTQGQDQDKADQQAEELAEQAKRARKLLRRLRRIVERPAGVTAQPRSFSPCSGQFVLHLTPLTFSWT